MYVFILYSLQPPSIRILNQGVEHIRVYKLCIFHIFVVTSTQV